MTTGFELIKTRTPEDKVDLSTLEAQYNLKLPPLYKLCITYFELGPFYGEKYFVERYNEKYHLAAASYPRNEYVDCTGLYGINEVFSKYATLEGYCDEDLESGLIRIADIGFGGEIFIATEGIDVDNVILSIWDREPMYEKLAENIFEFIQGFKLAFTPENELIDAEYSSCIKSLMKTFGEYNFKAMTPFPMSCEARYS